MHKVLDRLGKIHAECERTDASAKARGLQVSAAASDSFRWGYSDYFMPRKNNPDPMRVGLARDVFLMPDSHIEYDYVLGFEDEDDATSGQIIVAYRLDFSFEFDAKTNPVSYDFPVTLFWEAVSGSWKGSARMRHGEGKETPYVRPDHWSAILADYRLAEFGELASGLSKDRAFACIDAMMDIVMAYGPSSKQLKRRLSHG